MMGHWHMVSMEVTCWTLPPGKGPGVKGFNALYLTNVIASHENAKTSYCLDAGSLGQENKVHDAKKSLLVMPEPGSLFGHVLALSLGPHQ